ncbi:hypothetical protein Tco_0457630 [Tanacetum coccineum]
MENANPPPTNNRPALPAALRARIDQELHELHVIATFIDSRLESIEQYLNSFANQPNETNMNSLESDDEAVDTPIVYLFPPSDNDLDGEEFTKTLQSILTTRKLSKRESPREIIDLDHFYDT